MTRGEFNQFCVKHRACDPAMEWLAENPNLTPEQLWDVCHDGSWMLWIIEKLDISVPDYSCAADHLRSLIPNPWRQ